MPGRPSVRSAVVVRQGTLGGAHADALSAPLGGSLLSYDGPRGIALVECGSEPPEEVIIELSFIVWYFHNKDEKNEYTHLIIMKKNQVALM